MDITSGEENFSARIRERNALIGKMERQLAQSLARTSQMRAEMDRAKVEAKRARQEAETLRERVSAQSASSSLRKFVPMLAAVLMIAAVVKIAYYGYVHSAPLPLESQESALTPPPNTAAKTSERAAAGDPQFKMAMSRLQDDFSSLSEDSSEVVRQVNSKHPGGPRACPLEWTNGAVALSLDLNDRGHPPSLTSSVTQCADAVEKYRDEKDVSLRAANSGTQ